MVVVRSEQATRRSEPVVTAGGINRSVWAAQAEVLTLVLLNPGQERSLTSLASGHGDEAPPTERRLASA